MTARFAPAGVESAPSFADSAADGPILVVDDSPVDRRLAGALVEKHLGRRVVYAGNGREALAALARQRVSAVLTDMQMPEMDGLQLVEGVRADFPEVPVVLMTAHGSEGLAILALQQGASSYVPKERLCRDLADTLGTVFTATEACRNQRQVLDCLTDLELRFALASDPSLVPPLVATLQGHVGQLRLCGGTAMTRLGVALEESLLNGVYHGNLGLSSDLRQDGSDSFQKAARERRRQPPYCERKLWVTARLSRAEGTFVIRDEGEGFDHTRLPDPTDPASLGRVSGRGLLLVRTFMDEVRFNERGNEITLVTRRDGKGSKRRAG
jgi:CheY-like chemotaxis protein